MHLNVAYNIYYIECTWWVKILCCAILLQDICNHCACPQTCLLKVSYHKVGRNFSEYQPGKKVGTLYPYPVPVPHITPGETRQKFKGFRNENYMASDTAQL